MKKAQARPRGGPRRLEKEVIDSCPEPWAVIADVHLAQCEIVAHAAPRGFTVIERATLERCKVRGRTTERLILRESTIERVTNETDFFARNVFFDRVKLRGKLARWVVEDEYDALSGDELELALDFYDGVEWALDIREATLGSFELRDLPAEKILRDPERHFILRRDRLREDDRWRRMSTSLVADLEMSLERPAPDRVLLPVDETSPHADKQRAAYERLRREGFAE